MDPSGVAVAGTFSVDGAPLKRYTTYVDEFVPVAVDAGVLSLKTGYVFSTGKDANTTLSDVSITVVSPRLRKKAEKEPFFKAATVEATASSLDLSRHALVLGGLRSTNGFLAIVREKDGNADLAELAPKPKPGAPPLPLVCAVGRHAQEARSQGMDREDRGQELGPSGALRVDEDGPSSRGALDGEGLEGRPRVEVRGRRQVVAAVKGRVGFDPLFADLAVRVKEVDLVPLEAYVLRGASSCSRRAL